ncbi:MAG: single-stranded DNA-binding protein [Deltaproteobacteria bacterium]|nr:single-stranded DNA-binding protein [Deltaproteobacteria bacterium]
MPVADRLIKATRALSKEVEGLHFSGAVSHIYNPTAYAKRPHYQYIRRYGNTPKRVILLGMNPGPFGMAQTGVPFGEVSYVRDWLGIEAPVGQPVQPNPKRPIQGFACERSEVSGARLWGAISKHYAHPNAFFKDHFVANYCPLIFMEQSGRNITPDKLRPEERTPLFEACDRFLIRLNQILEPAWVIGVGRFSTLRAETVLGSQGPKIGQILHPSPANPRANRNWEGEVKQQLLDQGLCKPRSETKRK